jgi:glycosyltransferase involved in cell wall biosynthesis
LIRLTNNQGLNHAREEGISAASGDYIIFLDSDDMIAANALEKLYEIAHNENADIVIGAMVRRNPENESLRRVKFNKLSNSYLGRLRAFCRFEYSMSMCGKLVRRNLIDRHTFDMPNKIFHEDITTTFRLLFKAKSVTMISSPLYYYTMNPRSITAEISEKHIKDVFWHLHELVRLAISEKQIENVYKDIPLGVDRLLHTSICRVIGSEKYRDDEKIALLRDIGERRAAFPLMDAHVAENRMKVFLELLDSHQLSAEQKLKQLHDILQVENRIVQ